MRKLWKVIIQKGMLNPSQKQIYTNKLEPDFGNN